MIGLKAGEQLLTGRLDPIQDRICDEFKQNILIVSWQLNFLISSYANVFFSSAVKQLISSAVCEVLLFFHALCNCLVMCQHQLIKSNSWCTTWTWHVYVILTQSNSKQVEVLLKISIIISSCSHKCRHRLTVTMETTDCIMTACLTTSTAETEGKIGIPLLFRC